MRYNNFTFLACFLLLPFSSIAESVVSKKISPNNYENELTLSLSGAQFKSAGETVIEEQGCYQGVKRVGIDVTTNQVITGLYVDLINSDAGFVPRVDMNSQTFVGQLLSIVTFEGSTSPGLHQESITINPAHRKRADRFVEVTLDFGEQKSQSKICGIKVFYLPASEIIFFDDF